MSERRAPRLGTYNARSPMKGQIVISWIRHVLQRFGGETGRRSDPQGETFGYTKPANTAGADGSD